MLAPDEELVLGKEEPHVYPFLVTCSGIDRPAVLSCAKIGERTELVVFDVISRVALRFCFFSENDVPKSRGDALARLKTMNRAVRFDLVEEGALEAFAKLARFFCEAKFMIPVELRARLDDYGWDDAEWASLFQQGFFWHEFLASKSIGSVVRIGVTDNMTEYDVSVTLVNPDGGDKPLLILNKSTSPGVALALFIPAEKTTTFADVENALKRYNGACDFSLVACASDFLAFVDYVEEKRGRDLGKTVHVELRRLEMRDGRRAKELRIA